MGVSSASIQSETWKNVGSTHAASSTSDRRSDMNLSPYTTTILVPEAERDNMPRPGGGE
jgi:hypothetical protein